MDRKAIAQELDQWEQRAIEAYRTHPIIAGMAGLPREDFEEVLLQRRLLAFGFDRMYIDALCGLRDERARTVVRDTYRDEFAYSNHREDAVRDLEQAGIPVGRIVGTVPTKATQRVIEGLPRLVAYQGRHGDDIRMLTAVRMAGEVLPGIENAALHAELERRYGPVEFPHFASHAAHDGKYVPFGDPGESHTDRFGVTIVELCIEGPLDPQRVVETSALAMGRAIRVRGNFYDQFR